MNPQDSTPLDQPLLRDLVDGLSAPGREPALSVGIVGSAAHSPQPPVHCVQTCLGGDREAIEARGCAFLISAARNNHDSAQLRDGRCPQGYRVAVLTTLVGGQPASLLTVEGEIHAGGAASGDLDLLGHLDATSRLVQRVSQLLEENTGFANEVLQNYEQLNLIFDLTQRISQVTDVLAIERLLLQRIARLASADAICVVTSEGECRGPVTVEEFASSELTAPAAGQSPFTIAQPTEQATPTSARGHIPAPRINAAEAAWTSGPPAAAVEFVRRTRQVHVSLFNGRYVIAGPLIRLDDRVDVVLAIRRASHGVFHSGDMMLIESVLAFGGQIISNTELHERLRRMSLEVTRAMVAAIDKKDHYTSGHSERVGLLTRLTAAELGVPLAEQQTMGWAGLLHDVGKIGIPEEILCKPGKLTKEEFEIIKQHPRMGYEILKPIASLGVILDGLLHHHEYPDGSGYPDGLAGEQIPLVARIIHVADAFDALTSTRSYRHAYSIEKAVEIIQQDVGVHMDGVVVEAFLRAFEAYRCKDPSGFAAHFCRSDVEDSEKVSGTFFGNAQETAPNARAVRPPSDKEVPDTFSPSGA